MKGYVEQALKELEHIPSAHHQAALSQPPGKQYGAKVQYVQDDKTAPFNEIQIRYLQCVIRKFLWYARTIDNTMLHALNNIGSTVTKGTKATQRAIRHFMDYVHSNPNAEIRFCASDMILHINSDAAYLVASNACSQAVGYHYCGSHEFNSPIQF